MLYKADVLCKLEGGFNSHTALRWFPFHPVAQIVAAEIRCDLNATLRQSYLVCTVCKTFFFFFPQLVCHGPVTL